MKIVRTSRCTLKFATLAKLSSLDEVLTEYGKVVNLFIRHFWENPELDLRNKGILLKPVVDIPKDETWMTARARKVAAREAIDMVLAVRERWKESPSKMTMPIHRGSRMCCSSTIAELGTGTVGFDHFLKIRSVGRGIKIDLPIKRHRQFNRWLEKGRRLNSYIITRESVQFVFEIETGPKRDTGNTIGIDTGIRALATLNDGQRVGQDIEGILDRINRCRHGSKHQQRLRRFLRHYIDTSAREVFRQNPNLQRVVVERLGNMNFRTRRRRRLGRGMRKTVGSWNYRYWLGRVQRCCEENCVRFTSVNPAYTSQTCNRCGHTDRANRPQQDVFRCVKCHHTDHADCNAAKNILGRGTSLPYRGGVKPLVTEVN